jgi:chromosome segregation ATPase
MTALINDINKVLLKFKNHQIKDCNDEIRNIAKRIKTIADKAIDSEDKIEDLSKRKAVIDCQLHENSGLNDLIYMGDLNKAIGEWNVFNKEFGSKLDIYLNKRDAFMSKVKTLPSVRKLQNELANITNGWQTLISDEKKFLSEADLLIKDIDRVIGKIDNREITNHNNEIKDVNNKISSIRDKSGDIKHRYNELDSKADSISKTPGVGNLVGWTDYNKGLAEWNALMDEEENPKWKIYNEKLYALKSKVKNFPSVRKLQNEVAGITNGWQILISDDKNLLSEMDFLMKDMDRVIGKINRREITNYNNEIKDVNNRIGSIRDKIDDIDYRRNELNSRADSVSKTPGVGYMVDWTDKNKVVDEWNALIDEEDIPKWDIYNKKVETFNSITANLSNHP